MTQYDGREILSFKELCATKGPALYGGRAFLECAEFLKMVKLATGRSLTRRTLQFFSSTGLRLLPAPCHMRGFKAHYRHPEDTLRVAVILHLRERYFLPFDVLREIMAGLPQRLHKLVLGDCFTVEDMRRLAGPAAGVSPRDVIFERVFSLLCDAESFEQFRTPKLLDVSEFPAAVENFRRWLHKEPALPARSKVGPSAWLRDIFRREMPGQIVGRSTRISWLTAGGNTPAANGN